MKKIYFYFVWLLILLGAVFLTTGCNFSKDYFTQEEITVKLPQWPPQDDFTDLYPALSRWKIYSASSNGIETFYSNKTELSFTVEKNQPFCILAKPITFLEGEYYNPQSESDYFMPAGFLYPYSDKNEITWEQGFISNMMIKIIASKSETGVSSEHTNSFLSSFNWKKAQQTIEKKLLESQQKENPSPIYNPWLLDSYNFLDNLCYGNFKSTSFNITDTYTYELKILFPQNQISVLSSFIPENQSLMNNPQLFLKKNATRFLSDGKTKGAVIECYSAKKVSLVYVYMPIYIEAL